HYFISNFDNIFGKLVNNFYDKLPEQEKKTLQKKVFRYSLAKVIAHSPTGFELFFELLNKNVDEIADLFNPVKRKKKNIYFYDIKSFLDYCLLADQIKGHKVSPELRTRIPKYYVEALAESYEKLNKKQKEREIIQMEEQMYINELEKEAEIKAIGGDK
ncbi:hypothetical protein K8R47_01450, partial [archaeon]|nr:hypothetical protein [archaeon]